MRRWRLGAVALGCLLFGAPAAATPAAARVPELSPPRVVTTADGAGIATRETGQGPPLVMVPGYGVTMTEWDPALVRALARRHRVVLMDNRGAGASTGSVEGLTMARMAEDLHAVVTGLGLQRPVIFGYSMGGAIAQELALRYPDDVGALALVASGVDGAGYVAPPLATLQRIAPPAIVVDIASIMFVRPAAARAYARRVARWPVHETIPVQVLSAQFLASGGWQFTSSTWDRLPALRVPTLVAAATRDPLVPLPASRALAARIPGARLQVYRRMAHGFLFEAPRRLARAVARSSEP